MFQRVFKVYGENIFQNSHTVSIINSKGLILRVLLALLIIIEFPSMLTEQIPFFQIHGEFKIDSWPSPKKEAGGL